MKQFIVFFIVIAALTVYFNSVCLAASLLTATICMTAIRCLPQNPEEVMLLSPEQGILFLLGMMCGLLTPILISFAIHHIIGIAVTSFESGLLIGFYALNDEMM